MSDTPRTEPRTDACVGEKKTIGQAHSDLENLCRELERELAKANARIDYLCSPDSSSYKAMIEWRTRALALPEGSDAEQAALWRDLPLLDQMDLMVIFGGAENEGVLLSKLKEWIERKRSKPQ